MLLLLRCRQVWEGIGANLLYVWQQRCEPQPHVASAAAAAAVLPLGVG
jgi:hypothetical protein